MSGTTSLSNIVGSVKGFFGLKGQTTVKPFAGEPVQHDPSLNTISTRFVAPDGTRFALLTDGSNKRHQLAIARPGEDPKYYDAQKHPQILDRYDTSAGDLGMRHRSLDRNGTFSPKYADQGAESIQLRFVPPSESQSFDKGILRQSTPQSTPRLE